MGITADRASYIVYLLIIGCVVGAGVIRIYWGQMGRALRDVALWLLIMFAAVSLYVVREDLALFGQRLLGALVPGYGVETAEGKSLELEANDEGHFVVRGEVNGKPVTFLADTGASVVVLQYEDAERAGIDVANLDFSVPVQTANGEALAAQFIFHEVGIGSIRRDNVAGFIAQPGRLDGSLLGMSFLRRLTSVEMRGRRLILRD